MDLAVQAVTGLVDSPDHNVSKWSDYIQLYTKPKYLSSPPSAAQIDLAGQIEDAFSYRFQEARLLSSAFTHPSYPMRWSGNPCYQRLEFLGDSLLDMVCVNFLYERHPDMDPQWLTEHKVRRSPGI